MYVCTFHRNLFITGLKIDFMIRLYKYQMFLRSRDIVFRFFFIITINLFLLEPRLLFRSDDSSLDYQKLFITNNFATTLREVL